MSSRLGPRSAAWEAGLTAVSKPLRPLLAGYSLNALVDFSADDPIEVIKHLMIGSEGTLGFVSQVRFEHNVTIAMLCIDGSKSGPTRRPPSSCSPLALMLTH